MKLPFLQLDFRGLGRIARRSRSANLRQPGAALLGLSFDGSRMAGVWVRRTNGSVEIRQAFSITLSLDPLTAEIELIGREIRKQLDAAEVRERRCALCVPTSWVHSLTVTVPELPEEDIPSFLHVEAERGFPFDLEALVLAQSRFRLPDGAQGATLAAMPREQINRLLAVLEAAQLRPVGFAVNIAALQTVLPEGGDGVLALTAGETTLSVLVTAGGGVALLRTIEGAFEQQGSERVLQLDHVLRELRITLGQLPPALADSLKQLRVFGADDLSEELAEQLQTRLRGAGFEVRQIKRYGADDYAVKVPGDAPVTPALSLALRLLTGQSAIFELMPPRVTAWQQVRARYSSSKLIYAGGAAGAVLLAVLLAFAVQQAQLWYWGSQWSGMRVEVSELQEMQGNIRKFRPWYDDTFRSLQVLKRLTEAFPEDGSVSAKVIEIRAPATITCSGTARDNAAYLRMLDKLRSTKEIGKVQVEQVKGANAVQFTFNFQWNVGGTQ
jgi:hypothetical protein